MPPITYDFYMQEVTTVNDSNWYSNFREQAYPVQRYQSPSCAELAMEDRLLSAVEIAALNSIRARALANPQMSFDDDAIIEE
jgi:hypothetical protein